MTKQLLAIILALLTATATFAQDGLSAVIEIRYQGVEIKRVNSDLWFPLPRQAIAFIGAGDIIRTDTTGRVDIQFGESAHLLLLSNSEFMINSFTDTDDGLALDSAVNGTAVMETMADDIFESFNLRLNDMNVTSPATLMSVWSFSDIKDAVTVADGMATVLSNGNEIPIPAESGYLAEPERTEAVMFEPEWNAAALEANLYGCPGTSPGNVSLLVRTGPGQGFVAMEALDVNSVVPLMAQTESSGWTRIQFLSGFGWVQSLALTSDCTDLPVFSNNVSQEKFITVVNVRNDEIAILQPFFQSPATNAFTYQFVEN